MPIPAASPRHATLAEAWDLAFRCDPVSPFGGIVAVNRTLDGAAAAKIAAIFTEVIVAPDADEDALAVLARKKKSLRLLLTGALPDPAAPGLMVKSIAGGFLAQTRDAGPRRPRGAQGGDASARPLRARSRTCSSPSASAST